jgi:hypothetical protein
MFCVCMNRAAVEGLFVAVFPSQVRAMGPEREKMRPMRSEVAMHDGMAKVSGVVALVLAVMLAQGCKQKAPSVVAQPAVRSTPRVSEPVPSEFPPDDAVVPDANVAPRPRRRKVVAPPVIPPPAVDTEAAEEVQRRRDEALLKQQESSSQRQQQELNGVVQQSLKLQQEQEAEPRIQEAPEQPLSPPTQPGQEEQRIQDAPGPTQTAPAPAPPQGSPQG